MASRTTTFRDDIATILYRGLVDVFKEDPAMLEAGVRIRSWDGSQMDGTEISTGQMPMIRLSPNLGPNENDGQMSCTSVVNVRVEGFVAGLVAADAMNMWGAVQNCMVGRKPFRDTNVQCYLGGLIAPLAQQMPGAGAYRATVQGPEWGGYGDPKSPPTQFLAVVGTVVLKFRRPS